MDNIKYIKNNEKLLAIIIKANYSKDGVEFFTPNDFSQQLAYMKHKKGAVIDAHIHNVVKREVHFTKEVLVIRKGTLRVDFYDDSKNYLFSEILKENDTILLSDGGHGFVCIDDVEMIEIKQGPYLGEQDKTRFNGIKANEVNINE